MSEHDDPALWDRMAREQGGAPSAQGMAEALDALLARLSPGDRVLDIGCGSGPVVRAVASQVAHVHGIDTSPDMLQRARVDAPRNATFSLGTLDDFDDTVTCAVLFNVLHHLDEAATFARLHEILPSGGLLFVFEARHEHHQEHGDENPHHVPFTPARFCKVLESSGFAVEAFEEVGVGAWAAARRG